MKSFTIAFLLVIFVVSMVLITDAEAHKCHSGGGLGSALPLLLAAGVLGNGAAGAAAGGGAVPGK